MNLLSVWNNDICMSYTSNKKRCIKKAIVDLDFCGYHKKSKKYHPQLLDQIRDTYIKQNKINYKSINKELIKLRKDTKIESVTKKLKDKIDIQVSQLDNTSIHKLFTMKDSWSEVPFEDRIKLSDGWWDIKFILNHFTQQLNNTDMENSNPIYPSSPLTRKVYTYEDMLKIKTRIENLKYSINIALRTLLVSPITNIKMWYEECVKNNTNYTPLLLNYLTNILRFRIINYKDSQDCFTGYWVNKEEPCSEFETLYRNYQYEHFQIFDPVYNLFVINPTREELYFKMIISDKESWSVIDDDTKKCI